MRQVRRRALLAAPLLAAAPRAATAQGPAAEESFEQAERAILAARTPIAGGILLDIPPLSENGNSVDLSVTVESPWTEADRVTAIHILAEKKTYPRVARFVLSPRAGRAEVAIRIRLATTQTIVALAETSRGEVHRAAREVIVILGACVETG